MNGLPRLAFEQIDPKLQEYLKPTVERLGYFGEFFQVAAHLPAALLQFMEYTKAVKAPLSDAENEVLALAVCAQLGADYERIQHERLAKRLGFSPSWIAAAEGGADAGDLQASERMLRELAVAMIATEGKDCTEKVGDLARTVGPEKTLAALLQITRFMSIALLCNALRLKLPPGKEVTLRNSAAKH
jgi:alkylhydroperoxidase family enzyme